MDDYVSRAKEELNTEKKRRCIESIKIRLIEEGEIETRLKNIYKEIDILKSGEEIDTLNPFSIGSTTSMRLN